MVCVLGSTACLLNLVSPESLSTLPLKEKKPLLLKGAVTLGDFSWRDANKIANEPKVAVTGCYGGVVLVCCSVTVVF